jgi:glycosyltransferase involved in cell wall biosynthesis
MGTPVVSIVVPTYKSAAFIDRMIRSVLAQSMDDWELIIVDGASDDGTREIVNEHRRRSDGRIVFVEQPNAGCNAARNTGIDLSRGRYVALLDSDDEFLPTKLERQVALMDGHDDVGLVFSDFAFVDLDGAYHASMFDESLRFLRRVPFDEPCPGLRVCGADFFKYLVQCDFISTIVSLFRRDVVGDDIRFYEDNWYGLTEWMFHLEIARRTRVGYVNEPLSVNHFRLQSISRTSRIRNSLSRRDLLRTMKTKFRDEGRDVRRTIRRQLSETNSQLGMHAYKNREFGSAARYFGESFAENFAPRTGIHLVQSTARWLTTVGRIGGDHPLRVT